jgi:DNA-3-methyladenine glycosylase
MFGPSGISYVYLIYGMYHCLNIVTEDIGSPSAVLIRGLKTLTPHVNILDGPGKICREMKITRAHNGIDITQQEDFYVAEGNLIKDFYATPRIGIKAGTDKLWRFVAQGF